VRIITGNLQDFTDAFAINDTSNPAKMARYLDSVVNTAAVGSDFDSVLRVLDTFLNDQNTSGLTASLDQIQPSLFREFGFLSFNHNVLVNKTLHFQQQHLRDAVMFEVESRRLEKIDPTLACIHNLLGNHSSQGLRLEN
jgi:hypothetical protein